MREENNGSGELLCLVLPADVKPLQAILTRVLVLVISLFSRSGSAMLERWFLATHQMLASLHSPEDKRSDWLEGLQRAAVSLFPICACEAKAEEKMSARTLRLTTEYLFDRLMHASDTLSNPGIASLILLSAGLPHCNTVHNLATSLPVPSLGNCMQALTIALREGAIDAALTWTWHLVYSGGFVDRDPATLLLEVRRDYIWLIILILINSATCPSRHPLPSPLTRLASFKLIGVIIEATNSGEDQILLFQQVKPSITHQPNLTLSDQNFWTLRARTTKFERSFSPYFAKLRQRCCLLCLLV